ncbi:MAG: thioesterase domain-containing protein, partial [Arenimonas sp.]
AYVNLLRHLDGRIPIYGLQSRGLRGDGPLPESIEEIASDYLAKMRHIQPRGPYRMLGWSLGGLIAHAITAEMQEQGQHVEFLAMMDSYPFVIEYDKAGGNARHEVKAVLRFLGFHEQATGNPPATMDELADYLCREYDVFSIPLVREIIKNDRQLIERVSAVTRNNLWLARRYVPRRIDTDVVFFDAKVKESVDMGGLLHYHPAAWRPFVGGRIEVHEIDCHHQAMLNIVPAAQIGRILQQKLDALDEVPTTAPASVSSRTRPGLAR